MKDICEPRKTSKAKPGFPWTDPTVPLILVKDTGTAPAYAVSVAGKVALLEIAADSGGTVLSVWPGKARSDAFVVDDVVAALAALRGEAAP